MYIYLNIHLVCFHATFSGLKNPGLINVLIGITFPKF